ncbi:hypothetical protein BT93_L5367 [Corymbia citriodora subsp. variegata]|uniref:Vacuolar amino acid transporter YPQ3 n=1 Tax=Corymbia citriodora subsp. variegata TaxID=360336 RepID=A0A8T0CX95_CORYI|nr:hypothetical protein BT93_L5367 [Corymbia citriodora subsp. variegata]
MGLFGNDRLRCPASRHCAKWARKYMHYCLCSTKDEIALSLGVVSVITWGVAEIPQIVTNYKQKSAEGLSIAFLMTWVVGDFFNLLGCMLEPATLPTQYYMAVLYSVITIVLAGQTVYYGHMYPWLKSRGPFCKGPKPDQIESAKVSMKEANSSERLQNGSDTINRQSVLSSPIPLPALSPNASPENGFYYVSARSLSSSHTPTAGSYFPLRMSPNNADYRGMIEEPLLAGDLSEQSAPSPKTKNMLCLVNDGDGFAGNSGVGTFLGWAMAAIYMGGRLPQICLNVSILVSSLDWSDIRPNLPWLVDAAGCVLLDILVSLWIQNL